MRVFRHRGFSASMVTLTLTIGAFFATNVLTPLWLQSNMGYTATWAGYITGLIGILAIVSAPITAQVMTKTDPRRYYYRLAEFSDGEKLSASWAPWQSVDLHIDADQVHPVHDRFRDECGSCWTTVRIYDSVGDARA